MFGMQDASSSRTQNKMYSTNSSKSLKRGKLMCVLRALIAVWFKCLCFGHFRLGNPTIKCDYTKQSTEKLPWSALPSRLMLICPLVNMGFCSRQAAVWVDCLLCLRIASNLHGNTVVLNIMCISVNLPPLLCLKQTPSIFIDDSLRYCRLTGFKCFTQTD